MPYIVYVEYEKHCKNSVSSLCARPKKTDIFYQDLLLKELPIRQLKPSFTLGRKCKVQHIFLG